MQATHINSDKDKDDVAFSLPPDLDTTWFTAFETEQLQYTDFYTEKVSTLQLCCCYINPQAEVENLTMEQLVLRSPGIITQEELIQCIQQHQHQYALMSVLRFTVNLTLDEVLDFLQETTTTTSDKDTQSSDATQYYTQRFLTSEKYLETIAYPPTITLFNDLNTLFLIFRSKKKTDKTSTTTSCSSSTSACASGSSSSTTRKIKLHLPSHHRLNTRRRRHEHLSL